MIKAILNPKSPEKEMGPPKDEREELKDSKRQKIQVNRHQKNHSEEN
jgi:hypothetical protein